MTSSFNKINYALRPGKHAARRMLCEIFARLSPFQPVEQYVYVGFGSVWFEDFVLFHRNLGVQEMISIERDRSAKKRIETNKPFRTITVHYKDASSVLPRLDWHRRHYTWLDYEDPLSPGILLDVRTVASHAPSGTVLAVTVPCKRAIEINDAREDEKGPSAIERFQNAFGRHRVGGDVNEMDLHGWAFGKVSRKLINSEIETALALRNGPAVGGNVISFRRICEIEYDDGTPMVTVVGIFVAEKEATMMTQCGFRTLDFLPARGKLVRIDVPKLTAREVRYLERGLPKAKNEKLERGPIPMREAQAFAKLYRYLPNFAVLES